jgi:hypothetical protein
VYLHVPPKGRGGTSDYGTIFIQQMISTLFELQQSQYSHTSISGTAFSGIESISWRPFVRSGLFQVESATISGSVMQAGALRVLFSLPLNEVRLCS